jgi:hypothetical protein
MEITDIFNQTLGLEPNEPTTKGLLIQKLQETKSSRLYKRFDISMEDLQDHPQKLMEVVMYLDMHKDKIDSYIVHNWIDDLSMSPMIMLEIFLKENFEIFNKTMNDRIIHALNKF